MTTAARIPRNDTYRLLEDGRNALTSAIARLTPEEMTVPVDGGWSVKEMLTHIVSWEELTLFDLRRMTLGRTPANYCRGTDEWNPILMAGRDKFPLDQVLQELTESRKAITRALDEIADQRFSLGDVPGACQVLALHDWQHATEISNWRKSNWRASDVS